MILQIEYVNIFFRNFRQGNVCQFEYFQKWQFESGFFFFIKFYYIEFLERMENFDFLKEEMVFNSVKYVL